jgi:hypothetical protein
MAGRLSIAGPWAVGLSALLSALLLVPNAGAAAPQVPATATSDAVQQTVASVTTVTAGVTDAVERTTPPVTQAVTETTTRATEQITTTVEETVSRTTRAIQPAAHEAAGTVGRVTSGVTRQSPDSSPSSSRAEPPATPGVAPRQPATGRDPEHRSGTAVDVRADRPNLHPTGARPRRESRSLAETGHPGAELAPTAPATPRSTAGATTALEGADATSSGAPYLDLPAATGGSASATSTGFALGSLALLALALSLTAPGLLRRLPAVPAARRPAPLLYALERPG